MFSGKYVLCIALKGSIFMGQHTAIQNIINLGGKHFTSKVLLAIRRSPRPPIPPPDERTHTSREKTHTHAFVNTQTLTEGTQTYTLAGKAAHKTPACMAFVNHR